MSNTINWGILATGAITCKFAGSSVFVATGKKGDNDCLKSILRGDNDARGRTRKK